MTETLTGFVESVGLVGIFLLMVLEIPVPLIQSEIVMTFAGFTARVGGVSLLGAVLAGVAGSQAGSLALYAACRRLPEERVRGFVADHGGWLGLSRDSLERSEDRFRGHSGRAVLIGRLLPGLRSFIAVPAGLVGMSAWRFFAFNLVGTAFWVSVLALLGWWLGSQYALVDRYSSYVTAAFVVIVVGLVVRRAVSVRRARSGA